MLKYRLNEDFFDDMDMQEVPQKSASRKILDDIEADEVREYKYILQFYISAIGKDKKQEWYTSKLKKFQEDFFDILQISRVIDDFSNQDIIFYIQWWRVNHMRDGHGEKALEELDGVKICYPKDENGYQTALDALQARCSKNGYRWSNDITFEMSFTVDVTTIKRFKKFICDITKAFETAVRRNFRSGARPNCISYENGKFQMQVSPEDLPYIQNMDKSIERKFQTWFRAFNDELMPREIKKKWEEFKESKGGSPIPDDLKQILQYSGLWSDDVKVTLNGKDVNVTLPSSYVWDMGSMRWRMNWLMSDSYNIRVHGGKEYKFEFFCGYEKTIYDPKTYKTIATKIYNIEDEAEYINEALSHAEGCKNIVISVDLSSIDKIEQMNGRTLDLASLFPDYNVRVRCKKKKGFSNWEEYPLKTCTLTVISSDGKKKWDYEIPDHSQKPKKPRTWR